MTRAWQHDPQQVHRRRWWTLLALCTSLIVILLDTSVLNLVLPTLARPTSQGGLGASPRDLQWIVDAYVLVFAGLLLTAGNLGDRFGHYRALVAGLVVLGAGSVGAALSSSPAHLIAWRGVTGVGSAFIMPATLSIISRVFTDPAERGRAIGLWAGVSASAIGIGPLVGGSLLTQFWWGSVLLATVPIAIAGLVLGYMFVPSAAPRRVAPFDPIGTALSIAGLGGIVWAIIEGPTRGWGSGSVVAGGLFGVVALSAFVGWARVSARPMLDLTLFRDARFSAASSALALSLFAMTGQLFILSQYLQLVRGLSPLRAGLFLVPMSATMVLLASRSAGVVERFGTKVVLTSGLLIAATALAGQLLLTPESGFGTVVAVTVLLGVGMSHVMPPATASIIGSLPQPSAGVGSAVNETARQVGAALGVAVLGSLASSRYTRSVTSRLGGLAVTDAEGRSITGDLAGALTVADSWPAERGRQLAIAARESFSSGMHLAVAVGAGVMAVAAIGVVIWLPGRAPAGSRVALDETASEQPEVARS